MRLTKEGPELWILWLSFSQPRKVFLLLKKFNGVTCDMYACGRAANKKRRAHG